jgi:hypothetical protein
MVDVLWTLIGFVVGVVSAAIAVEFGLKKLFSPPEHSKITQVWSLGELPTAMIAATSLNGVPAPRNSRVLVGGRYEGSRDGFELRTSQELRGNFAVDATAPRALLFLGDIKPGAMAIWTVDERLIDRLRAEFTRLWSRSTDFVERVSVADVPKKANLTILTEGTVADVVPYRGNYLMRLTDHGETVGVLIERQIPVNGKRVTVTGVVRASGSGYPLIEAVEVRAAV